MKLPLLNDTRSKSKVIIQIILDDSDRITVNSSSKNVITTMGLIGIAQQMIKLGTSSITTKEDNVTES